MKAPITLDQTGPKRTARRENLLRTLRSHYASERDMRRGICLLNAGEFELAAEAFRRATAEGNSDSLARLLAACAVGQGDMDGAVDQLTALCEQSEVGGADVIRLAYALWSAGRPQDGIRALREALRGRTEDAELHFHLGVLLASTGELEEAELRFTTVESIDRHHVEGLVQLALCCAARHAAAEALGYLQRALARRPGDARIGLLTAQAAQAVRQQGHSPVLRPVVPEHEVVDDGVTQLAHAIMADPDFVDAFLSLPADEVEPDTYALLLRTIELALEREPEQAELHFHCGQLLARLGRRDDAILRNEKALRLRPKFTRALVELARLYQLTDRNDDALTRLREAIVAGAEYADVYYMLGNVHRGRGEIDAAREAYRHALKINGRYRDARVALESLAA